MARPYFHTVRDIYAAAYNIDQQIVLGYSSKDAVRRVNLAIQTARKREQSGDLPRTLFWYSRAVAIFRIIEKFCQSNSNHSRSSGLEKRQEKLNSFHEYVTVATENIRRLEPLIQQGERPNVDLPRSTSVPSSTVNRSAQPAGIARVTTTMKPKHSAPIILRPPTSPEVEPNTVVHRSSSRNLSRNYPSRSSINHAGPSRPITSQRRVPIIPAKQSKQSTASNSASPVLKSSHAERPYRPTISSDAVQELNVLSTPYEEPHISQRTNNSNAQKPRKVPTTVFYLTPDKAEHIERWTLSIQPETQLPNDDILRPRIGSPKDIERESNNVRHGSHTTVRMNSQIDTQMPIFRDRRTNGMFQHDNISNPVSVYSAEKQVTVPQHVVTPKSILSPNRGPTNTSERVTPSLQYARLEPSRPTLAPIFLATAKRPSSQSPIFLKTSSPNQGGSALASTRGVTPEQEAVVSIKAPSLETQAPAIENIPEIPSPPRPFSPDLVHVTTQLPSVPPSHPERTPVLPSDRSQQDNSAEDSSESSFPGLTTPPSGASTDSGFHSPPGHMSPPAEDNRFSRVIEALQSVAGAISHQTPVRADLRECPVCCVDLLSTDFPETNLCLQCAHQPIVCRECVKLYLTEEIRTGNLKCASGDGSNSGIGCPVSLCEGVLGYQDIQVWASPQSFSRYDALLVRQRIQHEQNFRWCKNPQCDSGQIHPQGESAPIITCSECKSKSCFTHDVAWHDGFTCFEYDQNLADQAKHGANDPDAASNAYIKSQTKSCPSCSRAIQKDGGCQHMTCRPPGGCGHEFCWECLEPHLVIMREGNHRHKPTCRLYFPLSGGTIWGYISRLWYR